MEASRTERGPARVKYTVDVGDETHEIDIGPGRRVAIDGHEHTIDLESIEGRTLHSLLVDGRSYEVLVEAERDEYRVLIRGEMYPARVADERSRRLAEGAPAAAASGEAVLTAPMPGLVVAVRVSEGDEVEMGQGLVILEAMKMENELRSPQSGRIRSVRVSPHEVVDRGQPLLVIG
ncbi:MAG: biotin/lipoyl-containing protein [Anaerolineae bacterium]